MKKYILCFLIAIFLFIPNTFASTLDRVIVDINILKDGSATVKEIWNFKEIDEKQICKSYIYLQNSKISDFLVKANDKTQSSSINLHTNHTDLCFDAKDGKVYNLTYKVSNFVNKYDDFLGTSLYVFDKNSNYNLDNITVNIKGPDAFNLKNTKVYTFGHENIHVSYSNKNIKITTNSLNEKTYLSFIIAYENSIFLPTSKIDKTFDDVYNDSYNYSINAVPLINFLSYFVLTILIFYLIMKFLSSFFIKLLFLFLSKFRYKDKEFVNSELIINKDDKNINVSRAFDHSKQIGNLYENYALLRTFNLLNNRYSYIRAYLLEMIMIDRVYCYKDSIILKEDVSIDKLQTELFTILGSGSKRISLKKLKKNKNVYLNLRIWFNENLEFGYNSLEINGFINKDINNNYKYNKNLLEKRNSLLEFKNYLLNNDFNTTDLNILKTYLIYGELFGVSDKVYKKIKNINPDIDKYLKFNFKKVNKVLSKYETNYFRSLSEYIRSKL